MIEIVDLDIDRLDCMVAASAERCLVRFWSRDWPLGQVHDAGSPGRLLPLGELAAKAIAADVRDYAAAGVARDGEAAGRAVSVVICTRDRPDALARCLASLRDQTLKPAEVIVVDNASAGPRTASVAEAAGAVCLRETRPGLDIARNTGARAARSPVVAFTDDDVALHPRWLERLVRAFDDETIAAVTGLVLPAELASDAQVHFETHWGFGRGFRRIDFGPRFYAFDLQDGCPVWEIGAGANMAFRRDVFDAVGGFDERLDVGAAGCSGDSEYWHRLLGRGLVCRYEPGAVAYHFHRADIEALSSQIFHYLRGHAAALMVQYERTGNRGSLRRAMIVLPRDFARRGIRRVLRGRRPENRFLFQEISGFLSGLVYYARNRRKRIYAEAA